MSFNLVFLTDSHMTRKKVSLPRAGHYYPSESSVTWIDAHGEQRIAGTCLRQAYLKLTNHAAGEGASAYSEWIFSLGKAVEEILVEQWKQMGIWVANNVKFYDTKRNISGEIDVVIRDPETNELVGLECKSFYGYQATRDLIGNKKISPRPKTSQLLQTMIYVDQCKNFISYFKMVYYARDSAARTEFDIKLVKNEDGTHSPTINGAKDPRFTLEDIYKRYEELSYHVQSQTLPPPDFELEWDKEKVLRRQQLGDVSKTAFEDWQKNSKKNPIGDWQCARQWCPFSKYCWPPK